MIQLRVQPTELEVPMIEVHSCGLPIIRAGQDGKTVYAWLADRGIKPWPVIKDPIPLSAYLSGELTEAQQSEVNHFAPSVMMRTDQAPNRGLNNAFYVDQRDWATTFVSFADEDYGRLVVLIGEYKQGAQAIVIVPPSGVACAEDFGRGDAMYNCAMRETKEETGFQVSSLIRLSNLEGEAVSARNSSQRCHMFLAVLEDDQPPPRGKLRLDATEYTVPFLLPLKDLLQMIRQKALHEMVTSAITLRALFELGQLSHTS